VARARSFPAPDPPGRKAGCPLELGTAGVSGREYPPGLEYRMNGVQSSALIMGGCGREEAVAI
jgi:hypothetical protein